MTEKIPDEAPSGDRTAEGLRLLEPDDFTDLQRTARRYCRSVDATRSRKRMNGSATIVRSGQGPYGTDDVSDDVTQDAVLIFAKRLYEITSTCAVAAVWVETRKPSAWQYVRRDGEMIVVTRRTLQYWAVRDAAARNGYRLDVKSSGIDVVPGEQPARGLPHADLLATLAVVPQLSGYSKTIFKAAWGDGHDFPTLAIFLDIAGQAEDLGRAGVIGRAAQALYGGPRNSSAKVQRTRDKAVREWRRLKAALDDVRDEFIYRSARMGQAG